ncbi:MAG: energy transducer TonB [Terriglobales bacterium]
MRKVQAKKCPSCPTPRYPRQAVEERIQGDVLLHMVVNEDGTVRELTVMGSPPQVLAQAALHTVRQWRYSPTLVNGVPVEVETETTVRFTLS